MLFLACQVIILLTNVVCLYVADNLDSLLVGSTRPRWPSGQHCTLSLVISSYSITALYSDCCFSNITSKYSTSYYVHFISPNLSSNSTSGNYTKSVRSTEDTAKTQHFPTNSLVVSAIPQTYFPTPLTVSELPKPKPLRKW